MPRFAPDNYAANLKLLDGYRGLAQEAGCSMAQLAIAWLLHKGEHIIPIPGTKDPDHLAEDVAAANVALSADLIARAEALIHNRGVAGSRYNAQAQSEVDTEQFQPA